MEGVGGEEPWWGGWGSEPGLACWRMSDTGKVSGEVCLYNLKVPRKPIE